MADSGEEDDVQGEYQPEREVSKEELKAKKEEESALHADIFQVNVSVSERKRKAAEHRATIAGLQDELKAEETKLDQLQRRMKIAQVDIKEKEEATEIIKEELSSIQ